MLWGILRWQLQKLGQGRVYEYLETHVSQEDPFIQEYIDERGRKRTRKNNSVPDGLTAQDEIIFKRFRTSAYHMDRRCQYLCFFLPFRCGSHTLLSIIPIIGPILCYLHSIQWIRTLTPLHMPATLLAKMHANVMIDLLFTIVPIAGIFFKWFNKCNTRNTVLLEKWLVLRATNRTEESQELLTRVNSVQSSSQTDWSSISYNPSFN